MPDTPAWRIQSLHALARDPDAACEAQLGVNAPPPAGTAVLGVDDLDLLDQPSGGERAVRRSAAFRDPRSCGSCEGGPRWHYVPEHVMADYVNTYMLSRPDVDAEAAAAVGACIGGPSPCRPRSSRCRSGWSTASGSA